MTFSYTSVFVFCSCLVSLHCWYVWILPWLLALFVNGSVSTFRDRSLSFWFVHVHKHRCAWHSLPVNICWGVRRRWTPDVGGLSAQGKGNRSSSLAKSRWTMRLLRPPPSPTSSGLGPKHCILLHPVHWRVWAPCDLSSQASWSVDMYLRARLCHELTPWEPGTERCAEKHQCPVGGPDPEPSSASLQAPAWFWIGRELC